MLDSKKHGCHSKCYFRPAQIAFAIYKYTLPIHPLICVSCQQVIQLDNTISYKAYDMVIYFRKCLKVYLCNAFFNSISPWTKWPPFHRRHFQMHFREWIFLYCICLELINMLAFNCARGLSIHAERVCVCVCVGGGGGGGYNELSKYQCSQFWILQYIYS